MILPPVVQLSNLARVRFKLVGPKGMIWEATAIDPVDVGDRVSLTCFTGDPIDQVSTC